LPFIHEVKTFRHLWPFAVVRLSQAELDGNVVPMPVLSRKKEG
jgi:hypothetical protein